jgi:hypothetical protein
MALGAISATLAASSNDNPLRVCDPTASNARRIWCILGVFRENQQFLLVPPVLQVRFGLRIDSAPVRGTSTLYQINKALGGSTRNWFNDSAVTSWRSQPYANKLKSCYSACLRVTRGSGRIGCIEQQRSASSSKLC